MFDIFLDFWIKKLALPIQLRCYRSFYFGIPFFVFSNSDTFLSADSDQLPNWIDVTEI